MIPVEIKYATSYYTGRMENYYLTTEIDEKVLHKTDEAQLEYFRMVISSEENIPMNKVKYLIHKTL